MHTSMRRKDEGGEKNLPIWLFVLPFFHPAAAQWERCQLEVNWWKPRPQQHPPAPYPRVLVNHYITFTRDRAAQKKGLWPLAPLPRFRSK